MKILFDFQDMIGGAPRSHLAHMMLLKEAGFDVIATIGNDLEELRKQVNGIRIIPVNNFRRNRLFKNIISITMWLKLLKNEKPDIIFSNRITQYKFLAIASDFSGIPLVFAQAGGKANKRHLQTMKGKVAISYSLENKKVFKAAGFSGRNLHIITNRIVNEKRDKSNVDSNNQKKCISVLMVGNIKSETINGYLRFFKIFKENTESLKKSFNIKIAGKDITAGKTYLSSVINAIDNLNDSLNKKCKFDYPGWVDNIQEIQSNSDVIIGKGRSVIEPAMKGKVCFVLAETGKLTRISPDTIQLLYQYNFSGRGHQKDDTGDFIEILKEGINEKLLSDAEQASHRIKDAYMLDHAITKLEYAFSDALKKKKNKKVQGVLYGLNRFVWIYILSAKIKLQKLFA